MIKDIRKQTKLTQQQLADLLGVSWRTWQRYESLGRMPPLVQDLLRIKLKERGIELDGLD